MPNREVFRLNSLDGGVVASIPSTVLDQAKGFATKTENMYSYVPGMLIPRPGLSEVVATLGSVCRGVFEYIKTSTGASYLLSTYANYLKVWDEVNSEWDTVEDGLTSEATPYDFVPIADKVAIVNGTDASMLWDGTTLSTPTDFPIARFLTDFNLRLVAAGNPTEPMAIYMCHPGDPTVWDATDQAHLAVKLFVSPDDGEYITSVRRIEDWVLIGKETQIYGLFGNKTTNFTIYCIDTAVGIGSHNAVKAISGTAYFPDKYGNIYRLASGGRAELMSEPIQDYINLVDTSKISEAWATVLPKRKYLISLPSTEGGRIVFVWDVGMERWYGPWTDDIRIISKYDGDVIVVLDGDYKFYKLDSTVPVPVDFETVEFDFGLPETDKEVRTVYLRFRVESVSPQARFDIYWRGDNDPDWVLMVKNAVLDFPVGRQQSIRFMTPNSKGRVFQLKLVSVEDAPFSLLGASVLYGAKDVV